jgi:hypothetical protein
MDANHIKVSIVKQQRPAEGHLAVKKENIYPTQHQFNLSNKIFYSKIGFLEMPLTFNS